MPRTTTRTRMRTRAAATALAAAAGLALPAVASAQPVVPVDVPVVDTPAAVGDSDAATLATALAALRSTPGADRVALAAAEAIAGARGSAIDAADAAPLNSYRDAVDFLRTLGIEPFLHPTGSPFCSDDSGLPLGIVPAAAGAVPGPWPDLGIPGIPLHVVAPGETLFAFVPVGMEQDGDDTSGMQLAWLNVTTLQGDLVPMGSIDEVAAAAVPDSTPAVLRAGIAETASNVIRSTIPFGGARVVPVETGSGTVLAAAFGTVRNGETSCFFLPTVGIVDVP
ncbi:hypothetical protein [Rhodococcus yananensis]|uniref:hypothetical protein n=1 Tax=Rhodococcus yananensis TaxID=2879464 RepID=UPI003EBF02EB